MNFWKKLEEYHLVLCDVLKNLYGKLKDFVVELAFIVLALLVIGVIVLASYAFIKFFSVGAFIATLLCVPCILFYCIFVLPVRQERRNRWKYIKESESDGSLYRNYPKFVDLGLPSGLLWADRNIGAHDPHDYGVHFAWGEISPKKSYDRKNYHSPDTNLNDSTLSSKCDVASVRWKRGARMPRVEEFEELLRECTWEESIEAVGEYGADGMAYDTDGYKVIGPNGNSIFLPACGFYDGISRSSVYIGSDPSSCRRNGSYWTATENDHGEVYALFFSGSYISIKNLYTYGDDLTDEEVRRGYEEEYEEKGIKIEDICIDQKKGILRSKNERVKSMYLGLSVRAVKDPRKKRSKPEEDA